MPGCPSTIFAYLSYCLLLAVLGLHGCLRAFPWCGDWGLLSSWGCELLIAAAPLVLERGPR